MTYQDKYAAGVSKDAADLQNDARTSARIGTRLTHECSRSDLITQLRGIVRRERNPKRKEATSLLVEMLENDQPAKGIERQVRVPLRQDGLPCASQAGKRYDDPGVAVFFTLKGKALSMAGIATTLPGRTSGR